MYSRFSKANVIWKLAYKIKYVFYWKSENKIFQDMLPLILNRMKKKKESIQEKEHNQEFSVQNFTITFILFKCPRSNAYFTDFHLFMLSWKGSR